MSLFPSAQAILGHAQESKSSQVKEGELNWLNNASYNQDLRCETEHTPEKKPFNDVIAKEHRHAEDTGRERRSDSRDSREHRRRHHEKKAKRHKEKREKGHDRSSSSKRRKRSRSRSREKTFPTRPSSFWLDDQSNPAEALFFIDSKSDRNNLSFDSVHYKDAAFYRTLGRTCLGGGNLNQEIFRDDHGKSRSKVKNSIRGRYFSQRDSAKPSDATVDMSKVKADNGELSRDKLGFTEKEGVEERSADPFIAIESSKSTSQVSELDPLNLYDKATQQYLGIIPEDDKESSAKSNSEIQLNNPTRERIAYFNNYLNENPQDTTKWIEFIQFQDELMESTLFNQFVGKQSQPRNKEDLLFQRKLSILEKALQRNPKCLDLQLEQVEICQRQLESDNVSKLWDQMLKDHPGSVGLWRPYLLYSQSSYSSFSVAKIAALYGDCIQDLLGSGSDDEKKQSDERKLPGKEDQLFEIFLQLCHFWHQSGHTEKAVAAFQAMIELNIFCPPNLKESSTLSGQLAFLETFWDSDEPKFGEAGAKGWSHWMHLKEKGGWQNTAASGNTASEEDGDSLDSSLSKVDAWLIEESSRGAREFLPWRPDPSQGQSPDDCEDPDKLVLFDDIGRVLFKVASDQQKWQLILSFLEFLGISTEAMLTTNCQHAHSFLSSVLQSPLDLTCSKFVVGEAISSQGDSLSLWHSIWHKSCPGILHSCDKMCKMNQEKMATESKLKDGTDQNTVALSKFVDNAISQLLEVVSSEKQSILRKLQLRFHLTKLRLSSEGKIRKKQGKTIRKIAKKTLSLEDSRSNLSLWEAYALWEWQHGDVEESKRIFETALTFAGVPKQEDEVLNYTRLIHTISTLKLHMVFCASRSLPRYQSAVESQALDPDVLQREVLNLLATLGEGVRYVPLVKYHEGMVTSGRIRKARKRFAELLEETQMEYSPIVGPLPGPGSDSVVVPSGSYLYHLCNCYALFQYLTVSLQAASVVYQDMFSFIDRVPSEDRSSSLWSSQRDIDRELLTIAQVQLSSYNCAVNPVPLTPLRGILERALSNYPSNPVLLEVFMQTESRSHVVGRLRRYFHQAVEKTCSPLPVFFAITSELRRQSRIKEREVESLSTVAQDQISNEIGVSHHIRSLFERAVRSRHTRHCILFWRMFIQFEVSQGSMKNAKSVFYRALQHCPWSKVLYMDMVRYFPQEIEEFIDLMMEKELRVRVPLEEIDLLMSADDGH